MNIEELFDIPQKENISLAELSEKGIMSKKIAYKNIVEGKLTAIKIGQRWYIPRKALLSFLEDAHKAGIESIKS
ncbi:helix-turn-helix domain-containing protein, partial [Caminibacter pacificus]